jgi:hypothetical protein
MAKGETDGAEQAARLHIEKSLQARLSMGT